jgi:thioredoxin 2
MESHLVRCVHCGRSNRIPATGRGHPRCGNCHRPLPWVVDAGDEEFVAVAHESSLFVLVDLWAPWCGPCRMVSPTLERLAGERAGQVKLVKVNVDEATEVSRRFAVQAVPTLLLLDKGEVIARQAGAAPANALRTWLDQAIASRTRSASSSDARTHDPSTGL